MASTLLNLPKELYFTIIDYLVEDDIVQLSLTCRMFYYFFLPLQEAFDCGLSWPESCLSRDNLDDLRNMEQCGFKFPVIELDIQDADEILDLVPPTRSLAIRISRWYTGSDTNGPSNAGSLEWEYLLKYNRINRITFQALDTIEDMEFAHTVCQRIIPRIMENLHVWNRLRVLELDLRYLDLTLLVKYLPESTITKVSLMEGLGISVIFPILEHTKIVKFCLYHCQLVDQDLLQLCRLLPNTRIKWLELKFCHFTDKAVLELAKTIPKSLIEYLDITTGKDTKFTFDAVKALFDSMAISKLKTIGVSMYPRSVKLERLIAQNLKSYAGDPEFVQDTIVLNTLAQKLKYCCFESVYLCIPDDLILIFLLQSNNQKS